MSRRKRPGHLFPNAADDRRHAYADEAQAITEQESSSAYRLAYDDIDFLLRDEMRPVRFLLELSKPELVLQEHGVNHSVVIFGSARTTSMENALLQKQEIEHALSDTPDDPDLLARLAKADAGLRHAGYYEQARKLAGLISDRSGCEDCPQLHVITGGGPGVMEAANRGAQETGAETVGLNIVLPHEQHPNPYITPELCFQFHYFALRKMHFMLRARALIAFPGGFGTLDELFETLTLIQTGKIQPLPVLLFGKDYWERLIDFDLLVEEGMIKREDLEIFQFVDDEERAWEIIRGSLEKD
jgi:uncharacterized protein (TIGR00730 family)